ncbi:hypothetical protein [Salidesulfovibrio brasiliensis]
MKRKTVIRTTLVALAAAVLPGCLAINMLLGAGSMFVGGPVQYASAAYTLGEYSYHYAVNDKNPGEVIEDKIAWLVPDKPEQAPIQLAANVPEIPVSHLPASGLELPPVRSTDTSPHPLQLAAIESVRLPKPAPEVRAQGEPNRIRPAKTSTPAPHAAAPEPASPEPETVIAANPKPVRAEPPTVLQRERRFRQLDRMLVEAQDSLRIQVPDSRRGINGTWQVRHRIDEQPYS